ncbi:hypothetical protein D3C85_1760330 [compost metagenome]
MTMACMSAASRVMTMACMWAASRAMTGAITLAANLEMTTAAFDGRLVASYKTQGAGFV